MEPDEEEEPTIEAMRVVVKEPGRAPEERFIEHGLAGWYATIGNECEAVETIPFVDDVTLVCDEMGKFKPKLQANVRVCGDEIVGTVFFMGPPDDEGRSMGLTDEQVERVMSEFGGRG